MTLLTRLLATSAVALVIAGPAIAQTSSPAMPQDKPDAAAQPSAGTSGASGDSTAAAASGGSFIDEQGDMQKLSSEIVGLRVTDSQNKKLGSVSALILDDQNKVVGAVLEVGGFLGLGSKSVGVPWDKVDIQSGDSPRVVIQMTEQEIVDAPEFRTLADIRKEEEAEQRKMQQSTGTGTGGVGTSSPTGGVR